MIDDSGLLRENAMIRLIKETAELLFSTDFIDGHVPLQDVGFYITVDL